MELRPYQEEAVNKVLAEWEKGVDKTLLVMATGTGKTIVFAKIVEEMVRKGKRCLILAHRGELLAQAQDKIYKASGLLTALEKAENTSLGGWERIVVGSIQTLTQDKRLEKFDKDYFDVIVVDEAHHVMSKSYLKVLEHFKDAKVLGVTATPDRGDMEDLGSYFETLAYEYSMAKGIKEKYLSPIKAKSIPLKIDLRGVKKTAGDYQASMVAHSIEPYLDEIAEHMVKECKDKKTIVFLPLVDTSKKFTKILNEKGFKAVEINGNSKDRKESIEAYNNGEYNVICNAMLLTEGFDSPETDCIIVLRPTRIRSLYSQMVGRGTRIAPNKDSLLLLDFLWLTDDFSLVHPINLVTNNEDVAKEAQKLLENKEGEEVDLDDLEEDAESNVIEQREKALADRLNRNRKRKLRLVDPIQYAMSIGKTDLVDYKPRFGWEREKPTSSQVERLEQLDIDGDLLKNKGQAEMLINSIEDRGKEEMATPKQIRLLEQRGFKHVGKWTKGEASSIVSRLAQNGWKYIPGIKPSEYKPGESNEK